VAGHLGRLMDSQGLPRNVESYSPVGNDLRTLLKYVLRIVAGLLVACLSTDPVATMAANRPASSAGSARCAPSTLFPSEALAPVATEMIHCYDGARTGFVRQFEEVSPDLQNPGRLGAGPVGWHRQLPRYTGAGETSIHKAIRDAERLLSEGKIVEAFSLVVNLNYDLLQAQKTGQVEPIMDRWNARYPAKLAVDILLADIPQFLATLQDIGKSAMAAAASLMPSGPKDDEILERARRRVDKALREAMEEAGYESLDEMVLDMIDSENVETPFVVEVAEPWREFVGGAASVEIVLKGIPSAVKVMDELEKQHPRLIGRRWALHFDPDVKSAGSTLIPGQRIRLTNSEGDIGPGLRNLLLIAAVVFSGISVGSVVTPVGVEAVGLIAHSVMSTREFFRTPGARANRDLGGAV
jgi:hypothetical protein